MSRKKRARKQDPHRDREASRYAHPIPSREFLMEVLDTHGTPMGFEELVSALGLRIARDQEALHRRLVAMERDGQLIRNRKGAYGLLQRMDLVRGRVSAHRDGFGFLRPDEGGDDLFLSSRQMRTLMHGDRIVARVSGVDRQGRREGAVVEILERATERVVGRYFRDSGVGFVRADDKRQHHDIAIPADEAGGAEHGQIVVAEVVEPPTKQHQPIGRIVEVLGEHMDPGMEIDIAIRAHEIPEVWPEEVVAEARNFGERVPASARRGREDIRDVPLVTIDGADARDFDDAVFCERKAKGWRLIVAIADVSAYVRPGTAIDDEARKRGNSVYFPERVIPMLPEVLSNGLCSLNPNVERLCMVCELYVTDAGGVTRSRFYEAVMRSHARLTYEEAAAIVVDRDAKARRARAELLEPLDQLYQLFQALKRARDERGALDLDSRETRIVFGPDRKIERIAPVVRNDAHRLIEECMIAANVAAARFLIRNRLPTLFRIHEGPSPDKLEELRNFLRELGLRLGGGKDPDCKHIAALIRRIQGRADAELIQSVLLRSMSQAVYSPNNIGHFGLALSSYAHFTSPIRRYPDLLVHRGIKYCLGDKQQFPYDAPAMLMFGEHTSMTERRADDATRDAVNWLKCEFMMDKVGQTFDATVSAVTSFGLFATLDDIFVDGLVHISALGRDYFHFDPVHHRLAGERSGRVYKLTDRVRVRVLRVDLDDREIDFELADDAGDSSPRRTRGRLRRRR